MIRFAVIFACVLVVSPLAGAVELDYQLFEPADVAPSEISISEVSEFSGVDPVVEFCTDPENYETRTCTLERELEIISGSY